MMSVEEKRVALKVLSVMSLAIILMALIALTGCSETPISDRREKSNEQMELNELFVDGDKVVCDMICRSHNYEAIKLARGTYQNDVCYCQDDEGAIWTFVM